MRNTIIIKIVVAFVLALLVQGAFLYAYMLYDLNRLSSNQSENTRNFIFTEEQYTLEDMVQLAYSVVDDYYKRSQDIEALKREESERLDLILEVVGNQVTEFYKAHKDELTPEEMKTRLSEIVARARFANGNYIWINHMDGTMVMHPANPGLDGKNLSALKDSRGKAFVAEMSRIAREQGRGMMEYMWPKPGEKEATLKVSSVLRLDGVDQFDWFLGTGSWVSDITEQMKKEALEQVASLRMKDGNYFWVNDLHPTMVMHPLNPSLNGKDLNDFTDPNGKRLFVEMARKAGANGDGFVEYQWGKPGKEGLFPKLSYVKLFEPWGWVIGMGMYIDEVESVVTREQNHFNDSVQVMVVRGLALTSALFLVIIGIVYLAIRRTLVRPMQALLCYTDDVSGGDLDACAADNVKFEGELLRLKSGVESMVGNLKAKMLEAQKSSEEAQMEAQRAQQAQEQAEQARLEAENAKREGMLQAASELEGIVTSLSSASEELSVQAEDINSGAEEQKARIGETATAMEQMNATVLEVARNAGDAANNTESMRSQAAEGKVIVGSTVEAISSVQQQALALKESMDQLNDQAVSIGQVMNVISDIADQTNLLALNAAIEAARAGDAGRGFAVVADEVRKLAEKTMLATKEVGENISEIQRSAKLNSSSVDQAVEAIEKANTLSASSGEALESIVALSRDSADQVQGIATASEEQSAASEQITQTIEQINELSLRISSGMNESYAAQQDLAEQAARLAELINRMKTENE